jgi:phosphoribosylformylglycinamidine synthase PurS subunit
VKAWVHVTLKPDVLDPQGKAIQRAATSLGYQGVLGVRQGKLFEIDLEAGDEAQVRRLVTDLSSKLLANPVIEGFEIVRVEGAATPSG